MPCCTVASEICSLEGDVLRVERFGGVDTLDWPPPEEPRAANLMTGPIGRTLLLFALPTLGSNILQSVNGSINAIWVSRYLGEGGLAATANANLIMFLMFPLAFGFGIAASILIGQRIGRGDVDGARRAIGTAIGLFTPIVLLIATAGWLATPLLLRVLATPPEIREQAADYLRVIFLAVPPMLLGGLISISLRSIGDSVTPFYLILVNAVLDAGLNPILIEGLGPAPRLGIAGSAAATLIANYVMLIAMIVHIYRRDIVLRLRGAELRYLIPDPRLLRVLANKGPPVGMQLLVNVLSALSMMGLVNHYGVTTTAAYGVVQQLWGYIQMPALAISGGVSAMAAQHIGAGDWRRVGAITRWGIILTLLTTSVTVLALMLVGRSVLSLFLDPASAAIPIARHIQLIASWSFTLTGVAFVLFATPRANGAVIVPLLITAFGILLVRVLLAWSLSPRFGADMIWWSFTASAGLTLILAILYHRFGDWRQATMGRSLSTGEATEWANADQEPGSRPNPTA